MGLRCRLGLHAWYVMTAGRLGYVRWERCRRGCGAARMRKGMFRWPAR